LARDDTGLDAGPILIGLRRELERDLASVREFTAVAEHEPEIEDLVADLDRQLGRVRGAAVITLVGSTGAGKSTLLNALAGRPVAREGSSRPTTEVPVIYRPLDADLGALLDDLPGEPPEVVDYDPTQRGPWREQILIDAPDINSVAIGHREVVRALAERSDVLVVVSHRQSVKELAAAEFVDRFAGRRGLLFVLNRADELTQDARDEVVGELRTLAAERWGAPEAPVLTVSAKQAQSQPDAPGWNDLCRHLQEMVHGGLLGRVRRHNALGTAERVARLFQTIASDVDDGLERLRSTLTEGLARWRSRVEAEIGERLDLRRANLRGLLLSETARRWMGPGGLALRAGGISAAGLGIGAAVIRRNPLLAAGATVTGLAAERAREAIRHRSVTEFAGILPGEDELESWYRDDLGRARLLSRELVVEPTLLGVPSGTDLAEIAARSGGDAFHRLVDRDLLEEAEQTARWYLRWPVDLPVYAMGAWVVYSAARGFLRGEYVGLDFLLNVALILAAWLFLARSCVQNLAGRRARRLLRIAREHASALLRRQADGLTARAEADHERRQEALHRLATLHERWRARIG
jgi:energy-coupling factor transporter ATP-binding protein EcfA2